MVVFGGPQVPINKETLWDEVPFADIIVKTEGEITFRNILECVIKGESLQTVPGIMTKEFDTGNSVRIQELDQIPSPYLMGVFDKLISENPDVTWNALIETNRGCPYQCTFCDWGSLTYSKVKKFELDRVLTELEWFGQNKIDHLNICDANFGMFPTRDKTIAEKYVEVQDKYGYPKNYDTSWAKNQKAEVLDIVKIFNTRANNNSLHVSLQTLDEEVLEKVKRKNLPINNIEAIFSDAEEAGITVFTEMILGLPGETLETWKTNYWRLYKAGNNPIVSVYRAQLLENAEMNLTQKNLYDIQSRRVYDYFPPDQNNHGVMKESVEVVCSTLDLSEEKMMQAQLWTWYQATFHVNGLTNYLSRFLYNYCDVEYSEFYEGLYELLITDSWFLKEQEKISDLFSVWLEKGEMEDSFIHNTRLTMININNSMTMAMYAEDKLEHVLGLVDSYMDRYRDLMDEKIYDELLEFQRDYTIVFDRLHEYPIRKSYQHDFISFLVGKELKQPVDIVYNYVDDPKMDLNVFIQKITAGRRRNFGKAKIERILKWQ